MQRGRLFRNLLILIAILVAGGCGGEAGRDRLPAEIAIGVIYPLSGVNRETGEDLRDGLELAVQIINNQTDLPLPFGRQSGLSDDGHVKLRLVYRDSKSDPHRSVRLVEELVEQQKVAAIIGCYSSTVTAAASERAEMLKIPFINAASTSPFLTARHLKWFFRTTPHDEMFAKNFFSFLAYIRKAYKEASPPNLALVYENRLWGTSVSRIERQLARRYGYPIVLDLPYNHKDSDFSKECAAIGAAMPAVILQASYDSDAIALMQGYKRGDINPIAVLAMNAGFISPSFLKTLGADGNFIFTREVWALDIGEKKAIVKLVNDAFKKRFQRGMSGNSARSFTAMFVVANAIQHAGKTSPDAVRQALMDTSLPAASIIMPWDGVRFDTQSGQNILGKGIIVQVQEGEYRTVWPRELSGSLIVWPMPGWKRRR